MTETASGEAGSPPDEDGYGGVFGAYPYAFRRSESWLFRAYVVLGGFLAFALAFGFGLALVVQVANTLGGPGGSFTFSRALFILVGLLVVAPVMAPVLFVARHHRRVGGDVRYDRLLAGSGFLFVFTVYLAVLATTPADQQEVPPAAVAPVVEFLYALPWWAGLCFPVGAAVGMVLLHRYAR
jgi:hypothetical protein